MDEVGRSAEVHTEVIAGMILARNVESVGDVLFGVTNVDVFACSKKRAYFVFAESFGVLGGLEIA